LKIKLKSGTIIAYNSISSIQQQLMQIPSSKYYSSTRFSEDDLKSELLQELKGYLKENPRHAIKVLYGGGFSQTKTRGGTMVLDSVVFFGIKWI